jgi:hypothetical protein
MITPTKATNTFLVVHSSIIFIFKYIFSILVKMCLTETTMEKLALIHKEEYIRFEKCKMHLDELAISISKICSSPTKEYIKLYLKNNRLMKYYEYMNYINNKLNPDQPKLIDRVGCETCFAATTLDAISGCKCDNVVSQQTLLIETYWESLWQYGDNVDTICALYSLWWKRVDHRNRYCVNSTMFAFGLLLIAQSGKEALKNMPCKNSKEEIIKTYLMLGCDGFADPPGLDTPS